jgi:DNA-binding response OmpR family regulator
MARVLVVEDDPAIRTLVATILKGDGFEVVTGANGEDGLRQLTATPPGHFSLVVLDLHMPVMDGRAFLQNARSIGASVPVLVLSAYGADSAARELGAAGALSKPFEVETLCDRVHRLVAGSHGAQPADHPHEQVLEAPAHRFARPRRQSDTRSSREGPDEGGELVAD